MRITFLLCLLCLILVLGISAVTPEADGYVYNYHGDMDGDKRYSVADVLLLLHTFLNDGTADPTVADVNLDGKVTLMDVLRTLKIAAGQSEAQKTPVRAYYPLSYLTDFCAEEVVISATAKETATVTYTAQYGDDGVTVFATVVDPVLYTVSGDIGNGDNVSIHMQAMNSIARGDRFAINFLCDASGKYLLRRYLVSKDGYAAVTDVNPTVQNDTCFFRHERTANGYNVTFFASYDFLRMPKEAAYGKVRMLLSLRNTDSASATRYLVYGAEEGTRYDLVNTWLVLDAENYFTRNDFDTVSFAEDIPKSSAYASLDFLDTPATISAGEGGTLRSAAAGVPLFSDRVYSIEESAFPKELAGKAYLQAPINGGSFTVTKAGHVVLAAGDLSNYDNTNDAIAAAGWTRILYAAGTSYNKGAHVNTSDLTNWYVKYCEAGETVRFGKWSVPFANGETVPFAWQSEAAKLIMETDDSYYASENRLWNGVPTIEVTNGGRLLAGWTSGDTSEGRIGNYDILAFSDDGGKTWTECCYVDTAKSTDPDKKAIVSDMQMWLDRGTNILYCFYIMNSAIAGTEKNSAAWMFTVKNPDADFADWEISAHKYAFPGLLRNNITVLSDGTWLAAPNTYVDDRFSAVYASTDKGATWSLRGRAYIPEAVNHDETVITELADGTLWMTVRAATEKKVVYQAYSFDKGETWTMSSPTDIFNCTTRFGITRLQSGALLMVYNAASGRTKMTAAVSYDDGKTWPYSVLLFSGSSSYPDISVTRENGAEKIHIIFDNDRYNTGKIYYCTLTEAYIRENNGKSIDSDTMLYPITTLQ